MRNTFNVQLAVNDDLHLSAAVGALRLNSERQLLLLQFPIHEGRRECVSPSGGKKPLTGGGRQSNACIIKRDWISPIDPLAVATKDKRF